MIAIDFIDNNLSLLEASIFGGAIGLVLGTIYLFVMEMWRNK